MSSVTEQYGDDGPSNGNVPVHREFVAVDQRSFGERFRQAVRQWWPYYAMMSPGILFFLIWHYVPIWEAKMAFEQVRIIPPNIWVGWKNFQTLFASPLLSGVGQYPDHLGHEDHLRLRGPDHRGPAS